MTYCSAAADKIGMGRCNHVEHQKDGESTKDFTERASESLSDLEPLEFEFDGQKNKFSKADIGNNLKHMSDQINYIIENGGEEDVYSSFERAKISGELVVHGSGFQCSPNRKTMMVTVDPEFMEDVEDAGIEITEDGHIEEEVKPIDLSFKDIKNIINDFEFDQGTVGGWST